MADGSAGGMTDARFAAVRSVFEANLAGGADVGASFCVTRDGETLVDLWGGWADEARTRPWEKDTLVNVYSTTKTMMAITALWVADQGMLDFDAPVARYWPAFAANGKADVKVSHLMSHQSGLSGWRAPMTREDLYDWEKATSLLAAQAPWWAPGTASGYHGITQGYLVGEVLRRITGRTLGTIFREEIAGPLGADFHIGLPASEDHRVADLIPPVVDTTAPPPPMSELMVSLMTNPPVNPLDTRTRAWRAAEISAANGQGNARSIAAAHAMMANGGTVNGKRIMSEAGVRRALEVQCEGVDLVMGVKLKFGMGFGLPNETMPLPNPNTIFWSGYGGSLGLIDLDARTTFSYAMNRMEPNPLADSRPLALVAAAWQGLLAA